MNWIELVGPSGIGKTTFFETLKKKRKKQEWVTLREGLYEIIKYRTPKSFEEKILQFYFRQELVNRSKHLIYSYCLEGEKAYHQEAGKYKSLLEAAMDYIYNVSKKDAVEKAHWLEGYRSKIEELCIFDYSAYKKLVLLDKGPVSYNPSHKTIDWSKDHVLPRGAIFFHLDLDSNFERIKRREKEGVVRGFHQGLNDAELKKIINKDHERHEEIRESLVEINVPFIDVDLQKDQTININNVSSFLLNLL